MIGSYKYTREEIVDAIKESPTTEDGYYFCKNFRKLNRRLGTHSDKKYIYNREFFKNKIIFDKKDIDAYLEQNPGNFNIEKMEKKDIYIHNTIKDSLKYKLHKQIPNTQYTLAELIDAAIYYFNIKYSY